MRVARLLPVLLVVAAAACRTGEPVREKVALLPVRFEGAQNVAQATLVELIRPDLERYVRSERSTALEDAAFRIRHHYRNEGYAKATVAFHATADEVVYEIREGTRFYPGRVHFRGNEYLDDEALEAVLDVDLPGTSAAHSPRLVAVKRRAIGAAYRNEGFLDVEVALAREHLDEEDREAHLTFEIREGERYRLAGGEGAPDVADVDELVRKWTGLPYNPEIPALLEAKVLDHYRESGHPFARATVTERVSPEDASVSLAFGTAPGPFARLGAVKISGNERTREGFIESRVDLREGERYSASAMRRAERRLLATGLFRSVHVAPAKRQEEGIVDVEVKVEERRPGEVSVRGGWGSLDGPREGADASYRNLFGGGEQVSVGATWSRFQFRTTGEVAVPFVLGTNFRPALSAYYEEAEFPSFEVESYGFVPSLSYPIWRRLTTSVGLRFATIDTVEVDAGVPPGDLLDFDYRAAFVSTRWDERDSVLYPEEGFLLDVLAEWSGGPFDSDVTFLKTQGRLSWYLPLVWKIVGAASIQGGVIAPTEDTKEIPISLRYFAGGTGTMRGFEFGTLGPQAGGDPTGGEVFAVLQTELRFPVWADLHGAVFHDRGNVWFTREDYAPDDERYSVGAGLRYHTPAGAIAVDYGWNVDEREDEEDFQVHISIGFPF